MISLIPTVVTVVVSIVVTSYIASYGLNNGIIQYPADAVTRLTKYFATAQDLYAQLGMTTAQDASLDPGYDQMLTVSG